MSSQCGNGFVLVSIPYFHGVISGSGVDFVVAEDEARDVIGVSSHGDHFKISRLSSIPSHLPLAQSNVAHFPVFVVFVYVAKRGSLLSKSPPYPSILRGFVERGASLGGVRDVVSGAHGENVYENVVRELHYSSRLLKNRSGIHIDILRLGHNAAILDLALASEETLHDGL